MVVAILTLALGAAPRTAVVDLSAPPAPVLAAALRGLPALKGRALTATQTDAIVVDAASIGLSCAAADDGCLQKLVVLARVDELIALEATPDEVSLARVSPKGVLRATARVAGSEATRARAAWGALQRAEQRAAVPAQLDDEPLEPPDDIDVTRPPDQRAAPQRHAAPAETPTASSGGVTVPLVVGMSGAGAALVLGASTVGVSAALAQQLRGTQRGIPLNDSFDALQVAFWSLAAATTIAVGTGAVGLGLFLADGGSGVSEQ